MGPDFVVSGYDRAETLAESVWVVQVSPERGPRPLRTWKLKLPMSRPRTAPPALAKVAGGRVLVAALDGQGAVLAAEVGVQLPGGGPLRKLGEGADMRFAPAVHRVGRLWAVAWTLAVHTPMRTLLVIARPDGSVLARHDITPKAMGAAAPVFIDGMRPVALLIIDPRQGVSSLIRVPLGRDGTPGEAKIETAVGVVPAPPQLAAARMTGKRFAVGYTAIGTAATTAIGLLRLGGAAPPAAPEPLVPGTAYVPLGVAAVSHGDNAVFATEMPTRPGKQAPRQIQVRMVQPRAIGGRTLLHGPDGTAHGVSLARRADGTLGVAYLSGDGVFVQWLRCRS